MAEDRLKVFYVRHDGHYLGGLSVAVARTRDEAVALVLAEIVQHGCKAEVDEVFELDTTKAHAICLDNGDY